MAARESIDRRRSPGVVEFLHASPLHVLIGCLVLLAAIFAADISTPSNDVLASLYVVPAAIAAAVLPTRWAVGAFVSALGLLITELLLHRDAIVSILAAAGTLVFVFVILRLFFAARQLESDRSRGGAARLTISDAILGRLDHKLQPLTKREREVAELVAEGRSARDIARLLHIGRRTVETHVARAYAKLGITSRVELILRRAAQDDSEAM